MSSYHELMVRQATADRNRAASPVIPSGAHREVAMSDVSEHVHQLHENECARWLQRVRELAGALASSACATVRTITTASR